GNNRIRKVSPSGIISTFAGGGNQFADGIPATSAVVSTVFGLTVDNAGVVYFGDAPNIRKVSTSGIISRVAGNGTFGFTGDGGPATSAAMNGTQGVMVDSAGNLYIGDYGNNRIRKVSAAGIMSTAAGNGTAAFSGDGGAAVSASLNQPVDAALDSAG